MAYWLVAVWLALGMHAAQAQALRIGVLPYLSPRTLLVEFAPLREFLASELQQEVEILTASDLPRFLERSHAGDFDLVISAPHFARLAQTADGYLPLVAIRADFYALLLVPKNSPALTLHELRGKTLHLPHKLSFVSMQIEDFLRQRGLQPEHDLRLLYYSTDNNAILATENSAGDAGAAQRSVFERMPRDITSHLRIIGSTQSALSLIILAHPRLATTALPALQGALNKFPYSEPGLRFFQSSHSEFIPADAATMAQLDAYLPRLKLRLAQGP
ncbi:MAG: phosphate/phosphite/phosphonate ABC transporter substrate-binding protein [Burkholderiales bacterium]|nr:phosphate/phosphite/phosphonate ABC transporter substrate-binding protein [Burkholderiales bacterium]